MCIIFSNLWSFIHRLNCCYLNKKPSYRLSKSDILRFADPRLENKVRVNGINLTMQGKTKFVRISEEFELSEFELSGVNYYKKQCQIQGELDLVRVSEEFELSEFELAGDYCIGHLDSKGRRFDSCRRACSCIFRFRSCSWLGLKIVYNLPLEIFLYKKSW